MQKLRQRTEKNTPTDAPLVRGNCGLALNRDESLSASGLKTCFNSAEVDLPKHEGVLKTYIYAICSPLKRGTDLKLDVILFLINKQ